MNECPTEDLLSKEGTRILLVRDVATVHPHRREVMERAEVKKDRSPARSLKPELFAGINRRRKTHLGDAALFNFRRKRHLDAASPHDVRRILPAADGVKRKLPRPSQAEPVADSASHRNRHWLIASSHEHRSRRIELPSRLAIGAEPQCRCRRREQPGRAKPSNLVNVFYRWSFGDKPGKRPGRCAHPNRLLTRSRCGER